MTIAHIAGPSTTALDGSSSTTVANTISTNPTAGSFLVAYVRWSGPALSTIADDRGNNWTIDVTASGPAVVICSAANVLGGATTVTATFSGGATNRGITIDEWSGVRSTTPLDQTATLSYSGAAIASDPGDVTPSTNGQLIVMVETNNSPSAPTAAGSFSVKEFQQSGGGNYSVVDQVQTTAATITDYETAPTHTAYSAVAATYKAATTWGPALSDGWSRIVQGAG